MSEGELIVLRKETDFVLCCFPCVVILNYNKFLRTLHGKLCD